MGRACGLRVCREGSCCTWLSSEPQQAGEDLEEEKQVEVGHQVLQGWAVEAAPAAAGAAELQLPGLEPRAFHSLAMAARSSSSCCKTWVTAWTVWAPTGFL
jgi:hypothetical protein